MRVEILFCLLLYPQYLEQYQAQSRCLVNSCRRKEGRKEGREGGRKGGREWKGKGREGNGGREGGKRRGEGGKKRRKGIKEEKLYIDYFV